MEIIGIAVILVALLLLVLVTTYNRNIQTQQLLEISNNGIQCSEMSAVVARMYSNRAITKETLHLSTRADLNRFEGKTGMIQVGTISCRYVGSVKKSTGEKDSDKQGTMLGGLPLSIGTWCFEKRPDTNVVVSGGDCP
jgi:hypothetical protein